MFDRVILSRDLADCAGHPFARKGLVLSAHTVAEAAQQAPALPKVQLADTPLASDVHLPLSEPPYRHLFRGSVVESTIARAMLSARLPAPVFDEVMAWRGSDPDAYRHALATAAVAVRMLVAAVGEARALPDMAAAALLHDIGMRHVPAALRHNSDPLEPREVQEIAAHPFYGAYYLATALGAHPAVDAALAHHWRSGQGYPRLVRPPSRSVEVVAVASAFVALTQPRPFRSEPYDARGAADVLIAQGASISADGNTVKLLVHTLRGARGDVRAVRFGRERLGHAPAVNRYTMVTVPARTAV
jgi:hypothetical protein